MSVAYRCDECRELKDGLRFHFQGIVGRQGAVPGGGTMPEMVGQDFCSSNCLKAWLDKNHVPDCYDVGSPYISGDVNIAVLPSDVESPRVEPRRHF